jgi:hypothetical protein
VLMGLTLDIFHHDVRAASSVFRICNEKSAWRLEFRGPGPAEVSVMLPDPGAYFQEQSDIGP